MQVTTLSDGATDGAVQSGENFTDGAALGEMKNNMDLKLLVQSRS